MNQLPRILIVEDERALGLALAATVRQASALGEIAPTAAIARKLLGEGGGRFSAMILDIGLPDENGLNFLASLPEEKRLPTIVITAHGEIENTIAARKLGVSEFLTKPLDFSGFTVALKRILPKSAAGESSRAGRYPGPFIGAAPGMRPVFQQIAHACATGDPVLISGETGSGKSLATTLIHRNSDRSDQAVVTLRPGAGGQAEALGGALARAAGGVLILEDLEDFDADAQAELVCRWDEGREGFPRILATTGTDLHPAVEAGKLRSDLYYRLQVLEVRLPALRQRIEDLPALIDFFLGELEPGRAVSVDRAAMRCLQEYAWPGNLRELRNVASYALTVGGGAAVIDLSHLPAHLVAVEARGGAETPSDLERELGVWIGEKLDGLSEDKMPTYRELADELERLLLQGLLGRFDGKLSRLVGALKGNRTTLRKKLQQGPGKAGEL